VAGELRWTHPAHGELMLRGRKNLRSPLIQPVPTPHPVPKVHQLADIEPRCRRRDAVRASGALGG